MLCGNGVYKVLYLGIRNTLGESSWKKFAPVFFRRICLKNTWFLPRVFTWFYPSNKKSIAMNPLTRKIIRLQDNLNVSW